MGASVLVAVGSSGSVLVAVGSSGSVLFALEEFVGIDGEPVCMKVPR